MLDKIELFTSRILKTMKNNTYLNQELCNGLIETAVIAKRLVQNNEIVDNKDKWRFERQAIVGRYFSDWNMDIIAEEYHEISSHIKSYHWNNNLNT